MTSTKKLRKSIVDLERALEYKDRALSDSVFYGAIAKAFEVAVEYAWKYFRAEEREAGLEVEAPRDAIKQAAVLGMISEAESWLRFLKIRNIAVHDYLGVKQEDYLNEADSLLKKLRQLQARLPQEEG